MSNNFHNEPWFLITLRYNSGTFWVISLDFKFYVYLKTRETPDFILLF